MDIKKIVKRNLKFMGETAVDIAVKIVVKPFAFGYTHASYIYFYATHPHDYDWARDRFMRHQLHDFNAAVEDVLDKFDEKLSINHSQSRSSQYWFKRIALIEKYMIDRDDVTFYDYESINHIYDRLEATGIVCRGDRATIRHLEDKYCQE